MGNSFPVIFGGRLYLPSDTLPLNPEPAPEKNQIRKPLYWVAGLVLLFSVLSFLPTEGDWLGIHWKKVDLFSDLATQGTLDSAQARQQRELRKPYQNYHDRDSLDRHKGFYRMQHFEPAAIDALAVVYKAMRLLKEKKKGSVRIGWFGDSLIEGDILTQDVRDILQRKFGGAGVGFVPITNNVPGFRQSIGQQFSKNWKVYSVLEKRKDLAPLSIGEEIFVPAYQADTSGTDSTKKKATWSYSWVSFSGVKAPQTGLDKFYTVRLFYSHVQSTASIVLTRDGHSVTMPLQAGEGLQSLLLNESKPVQRLQITFQCSSEMYVYGVSFDQPSGVFVDDFSLRGSSGLPLSSLNTQMMNQFQDQLGYDVIVLHFGLNVVSDHQKDYGWYLDNMKKTIEHLKTCFPGATLLLVSCSDRSAYRNGSYVTMENLPAFVQIQQQIAKEEKISFWNLFQAMGGYGSMADMVGSKQPLANKDYTHFKPLGGQWLARYFTDAFLYDYNYYFWKLKNPEPPKS